MCCSSTEGIAEELSCVLLDYHETRMRPRDSTKKSTSRKSGGKRASEVSISKAPARKPP